MMREVLDPVFDDVMDGLLKVDALVLAHTEQVRDMIARTDRILANCHEQVAPGTGSDSFPPVGDRS
jgi:hypothetical protein